MEWSMAACHVLSQERALCYAVVPIWDRFSMDKLSNYLEENSYIGTLFVKNLLDHPYIKEWKAANCTLKRNGQPPTDSNRTTPPSEKEPERHKEIFAGDLIGDGDSCEPGPSVGIVISPETKPSTAGPIGSEKNRRIPAALRPGLPRRETKPCTSPAAISLLVGEMKSGVKVESSRPTTRSGDAGEDNVVRVRTRKAAKRPRRIIKEPVPDLTSLSAPQFRKRCRMSPSTFASLCIQLIHCQQRSAKGRRDPARRRRLKAVSTEVKIAAALEILAGRSQPSAVPWFDDIMEAMVEWSETMISWPSEVEGHFISNSFFKKTSVDNIVGCIAGSRVWASDSSNSQHRNDAQSLNVGFVCDHRMRFRWVFAKYYADVDDNTVFRRSVLYDQFCDGTARGCLIGGDNYQSEFFLLTPSSVSKQNAVAVKQAKRIAEAYETVLTAVRLLKNQFPILTGASSLPVTKLAKVVIVCAALFNLTRMQDEATFDDDEERLPFGTEREPVFSMGKHKENHEWESGF